MSEENTPSIYNKATHISKHPRTKKIAIAFIAFMILFGLVGYLWAPGFIKTKIEEVASKELNRKVTVESIDVSPYQLAVTVNKLKINEPESENAFVSFDKLEVNTSIQSLFRLVPVIEELKLENPYLHIARTENNKYNFSDLIEKFMKDDKKDEPTKFAVYNIQIENGKIVFDDIAKGKTHQVTELKIGIPFISNFSSSVDSFIEPNLSAKINDSPFKLTGKVLSNDETKKATVNLNLEHMSLPKYVQYLPFKPSFLLPSANLSLNIDAIFNRDSEHGQSLLLKGKTDIDNLKITEPDETPMISSKKISVTLTEVDVFNKKIHLGDISLYDPVVQVTARKDGYNLNSLAPKMESDKNDTAKEKNEDNEGDTLSFLLDEFNIHNASVELDDNLTSAPISASLSKFNLNVKNIRTASGINDIVIGGISSDAAIINVINKEAKNKSQKTDSDKSQQTQPSSPSSTAITLEQIAVNNWDIRFENQQLKKHTVTNITPFSLNAQNISTKDGSQGQIDIQTKVNNSGAVSINGDVGIKPVKAKLNLDLKEVDVTATQPYFTDYLNLVMTSARATTKGTLSAEQNARGRINANFKGDVAVSKLQTFDKVSNHPFVHWGNLAFNDVNLQLEPLNISVNKVSLDNFFARIILFRNARLNLSDVIRSKDSRATSLTDVKENETQNKNSGDSQEQKDDSSSEQTEKTTLAANGENAEENKDDLSKIKDVDISTVDDDSKGSIKLAGGKNKDTKIPPVKVNLIQLNNGRVYFTDQYIRPNYSANMMSLNGTISNLSSNINSISKVNVKGKVNKAPLKIFGAISPLQKDPTLDITGEVKGMELAQFSTYSAKYAGYNIEKGKLSFDVNYKLAQRKLLAENHLILDQLTFGDKVESPHATKLPVLLAVSLLRDNDGVIDLNLPISGSLDDPEFSIGGIIIQVIVNLLKKAATAPFSLLASAFGGSEELGWLDFDAGRSVITPKGEEKLTTLAKALNNRKALKLEITGRADPENDQEGMVQEYIKRQMRIIKSKKLAEKGESMPLSKITISDKEYSDMLKDVYKNTDFENKPTNFLGMQKSVPQSEMESLMVKNMKFSEEDWDKLAMRRAENTKDWLITKGGIPEDRVFILASKIGKKGKEKTSSKVDFSLK